MSLFDQLGRGQQGAPQGAQQRVTPMDAMRQLQNDPAGVLSQAGYSIPEGMTNPYQIAQHLRQSGQLSQARYQAAQQMMQNPALARMFGRR